MQEAPVAGCLAVWDQSAFKQAVVRGYAPRLARWRPWINRLAPAARDPAPPRSRLASPPRLPSPTSPWTGTTPDVFQALIESACAEAQAAGYAYSSSASPPATPGSPGSAAASGPASIASVLHTVHWGRRTPRCLSTAGLLPHVEAALL